MSGACAVNLKPKVISVRNVARCAYVLRLERLGLVFRAGQSITLGLGRMRVNREYTIYSGEHDEHLEVLIREVQNGTVSPALRRCQPGDELECAGPYGRFVIENPEDTSRRYLFVATGTGIAPFHAFVRSYPSLNYRLVHGVRLLEERYDMLDYAAGRYFACVSRENGGDFHGRVTDFLRLHRTNPQTICYICGNGRMISEAYDILRAQGIPSDQIHVEAFF
ncbi:MAG: FAD-binding oxidoreductase [Verrucomicrobiae bacterium]|nr:FAD-binding oxidoreductase [Verrucomicrobiae bacterium]